MLLRNRAVAFVFALVISAAGSAAWAHEGHQHDGDIIVGRTLTGQLSIEADLDEPVVVEASSGALAGWVGAEPGFEALEADEPDEGFYGLAGGASVWLEVITLDTGLKVWQSDAGAVAAAPGERVLLGAEDLHSHVFWHIDSSVPGIGPDWQGTLSGTFRLVDTGDTAYAASEPFTVQVTNVPEPMTLALLGLSAAMWLRRLKTA